MWQYKLYVANGEIHDGNTEEISEILNNLGKDGWERYSFVAFWLFILRNK